MYSFKIPSKFFRVIQDAVNELLQAGYCFFGGVPSFVGSTLHISERELIAVLSHVDKNNLSEFEVHRIKDIFLKVLESKARITKRDASRRNLSFGIQALIDFPAQAIGSSIGQRYEVSSVEDRHFELIQ